MKIKVTNTDSTLVFDQTDRQGVIDLLYRNHLTKAPGYRYTYAFRTKQWDGNVSLIDEKRSFLSGLTPKMIELITECGEIITIDDQRIIPSNFKLNQTNVSIRDYQYEAIKRAFENVQPGLGWWPRGVFRIATGGGKTEVAVAMYEMANVPTLFLVHTQDLLYQAQERFEKVYGIQCGIIGNGVYKPNLTGPTAITMQTADKILRDAMYHPPKKIRVKLGDRYKFKTIPEHNPESKHIKRSNTLVQFFNSIEQVFFDEAHLMAADLDKGNAFIRISKQLPNAYMRWGLTATPFMRDNYSNLLLEGACGDLICNINNKYLIDRGWLTPVKVKIVQHCGPKLSTKIVKSWRDAYEIGIIMNDRRNDTIVKMAKSGPHPCIILTNETAHSDMLHKKTGFPVVQGSTLVHKRKEIAHKLKTGQIKTAIVNRVWDEGIDLPELRMIVLAGGGKSHIKALQRAGRGLRLANKKNEVIIVDFADTIQKHLRKHANLRRQYWEDECFTIEEV